jgi:hypothetical protein
MKLRQQVSTPWKLINENGCCWDAVHALMCTFCGHTNFTTTIWRHSELTDAFQRATHSLPKSSVRLSHLQPFLMPLLHQEAHFATLPAAIHQMIGPVATRNNPFYATRDASTKEDELLRSDFARESERIMREAAQTATPLSCTWATYGRYLNNLCPQTRKLWLTECQQLATRHGVVLLKMIEIFNTCWKNVALNI